MMVSKALADEVFAAIGDQGLCRENDFTCVQNGLIAHDCHLRLVVTKRLHPEEQLVKYYTY